MPKYKYQPYYYHAGATRENPFREALSDQEVKRRLDLFFEDVERHFEGLQVRIERLEDGILCIDADVQMEVCDLRVKRCLNSLDLYAHKVP